MKSTIQDVPNEINHPAIIFGVPPSLRKPPLVTSNGFLLPGAWPMDLRLCYLENYELSHVGSIRLGS